ncbi:uncharacterized protein KY384_007712 [Bacidia gigantensis]|uniref:uncharacterized protein n=1 Tax=Bacidia gigantensis TaxID=2732470 RepID=UPI001D04B867|nr:uncharacterized protein KY384_007712 [Bacidia gigantensis]KAG8527560.1 hypothetical protein KY384_007712 [Bacidia gigantensis]
MVLICGFARVLSPFAKLAFSTAVTDQNGANGSGTSSRGAIGLSGESSDLHKVKRGRIIKRRRPGGQKTSRWSIPFLGNLFTRSQRSTDKVHVDSDTNPTDQISDASLDFEENIRTNSHPHKKSKQRGHKLESRKHDFKDWSSEEIWLYTKLDSRGSTTEFQTLVDNGPRCRDALNQRQRPESSLNRGIERYQRWSIRDAKLKHKIYPNLIVIVAAKAGEAIASTVRRTTNKLKILHDQWQDAFSNGKNESNRTLQVSSNSTPTLYAMIIKFSVVSIVTFDPSQPARPIKIIANLNHTLDGRDVWHAYAISIVCVRARNYLMGLEESGCFADKVQEDNDPDA